MHVGRERGYGVGRGAKVESHTVKQGCIVGKLVTAHGLRALGRRIAYAGLGQLSVRLPLLGRVLVKTVETRGIGHIEIQPRTSAHVETAVGQSLDLTVADGLGFDYGAESGAPLRVITQLFLKRGVARQRLIGRIAGRSDGVARGHGCVRQLRVECDDRTERPSRQHLYQHH